MQDPGGGIIAAPEFQFEFTACGGYGYCWGRDAGFISLAMDTAGLHEESAHFYQYMAKCQSENGSFLHRHDMQGHLGPSWGLLQPDETGSVLFGLWKHVQLSGRKDTAAPLRGMVERAAQWLNTCRFDGSSWPAEGFDLWEEREGVHLYSVAAVIAGLSAAAQLAEHMGWASPVGAWRERASQLSQLLEEHLVADQVAGETSFARTLFLKNQTQQPALHQVASHANDIGSILQPKRWLSDFVVDISLLGVVEPFDALPQGSAAKMLPALCKSMRRHLWRRGVGGIGRYEGDHYRDGQPWILTTLWLALAAARCGDKPLATECLAWVLAHTPREGQLPEQIDPNTGEPSWVMPLTWSHAMFVLACADISKDVWSSAVQAASAISKIKNTSTRGL
jgi:GH15 family glucan-1,4-alpha-glucosidase